MSRPLRVLIVDGQEGDARLILQSLREGGYAPFSLRVDSAQALALALETQPWDVALCEYALPKYDGTAALALIRSRKPDLPVIFLTGALAVDAAIRLVKAGAYDCVLKDGLTRLPRAVEQAIGESIAQRLHEEMQQALHNTTEQLRGVLEAAIDGIIEIDASGTIMLANAQAHHLFGWPPGALISQPISTIMPQEHWEQHRNEIQVFLKTGNSASLEPITEVTGLHHDGTKLYCEHSVSPLMHYSGEQRFVVTLRDITARKQAERLLATQYTVAQILIEASTLEEAYAKILPTLGTCLDWGVGNIWHIDPAVNLLRCIETWQAPQMEAAEFLADSRQRTFAPGVGTPGRAWGSNEPLWISDISTDSNCPRAPLAAKTGLHAAIEAPIMTEKRIYGIIEFLDLKIRDPDTLALKMLGDIGLKVGLYLERKETEEFLQAANAQLAEIVRSAPVAITAVDNENKVLTWNPTAEHLFGWTEAEVLGKPIPTIPEDKYDEHVTTLQQVLAGKIITRCEVQRKNKNGKMLLLSCSKSPLQDSHHRQIGMLCIGVDITEHKLLEAQAKRMDRLATLGQLLSGIAHELKNPLFIITGRLYLLKENLQGQIAPEIATDITAIAGAVERMTKIVERFLQLARPIVPARVLVSMEDMIRQTLDFLANELMKNQITVVQDFAPNLPQIWTDPNQIHGALLNLCLNAIQAMTDAHGQGTLTVTTALVPSDQAPANGTLSGRGPWVEIRIQDDGPGVPPAHQAKLFEPFFTTRAPSKGTGLGLWIVRSTVMALHGTAHYDNAAGQGATFVIRLPVEPPESEAADPSQPAPTQSNS